METTSMDDKINKNDLAAPIASVEDILQESPGYSWSQNIRLLLAIVIVFLSAIILWWILA